MPRPKAAAHAGVYLPDAPITAVIAQWHEAKLAQAKAAEDEQAAFDRLNGIVDELLGEGSDATFIVPDLGEYSPAKAGRRYDTRGAGVDYARVAQLIEERLGKAALKKYFTAERVTVQHANEAALAAASSNDPRIAAILEECTNEGTPTLTRVPPAKAGKELAAAAVALPAKKAAGKLRAV
ncbi:MAG: hypothetical protein Q8Q14_13340 [Gemmatimonadales bacterium]|nr:hypothetical protein [Gemmatimonadales bacterium]